MDELAGRLPEAAKQKIRSSDIRRQCAPHRHRDPCFICGKHRSITEAHHTIPLEKITALLKTWGTLPEPPIVWLCPNCHTYVHSYQNIDPLDLEPAVLKKIFEIQDIGWTFLGRYMNSVLATAKQIEGDDHD